MSFSAELSSFETDCNIIDDDETTTLLLLRAINVRHGAGANEDTKDAIASRQRNGLIVSVYEWIGEVFQHETGLMNSYAGSDGRAKIR